MGAWGCGAIRCVGGRDGSASSWMQSCRVIGDVVADMWTVSWEEGFGFVGSLDSCRSFAGSDLTGVFCVL